MTSKFHSKVCYSCLGNRGLAHLLRNFLSTAPISPKIDFFKIILDSPPPPPLSPTFKMLLRSNPVDFDID